MGTTMYMYRIAGNIGECFNLANWRFWKKPPNLNPFNPFMTTVDTAKWRRIAKLKLAKCRLWSKPPNFLLANISRYTVSICRWNMFILKFANAHKWTYFSHIYNKDSIVCMCTNSDALLKYITAPERPDSSTG